MYILYIESKKYKYFSLPARTWSFAHLALKGLFLVGAEGGGGGLGKERRGGAATSNPLPPPPIYLYTQIPLLPVINKWGERGGGWVFAKQRKGPSRMGKDAGSWAKRKKPLAYLRFINISPPSPPPS